MIENSNQKTSILSVGNLKIDKASRYAQWQGENLRLSKIEHPFLLALATVKGGHVTRAVFENIRSRAGLKSLDRAVDLTIKRLRVKINAIDPDFNDIKVIYGIGYMWVSRRQHRPSQNLGQDGMPVTYLDIDHATLSVTLNGKYLRLNASKVHLLAEMSRSRHRYQKHDNIIKISGIRPTDSDIPGQARNLIRRIRDAVRDEHPEVEMFEISYGVGIRIHSNIIVRLRH